MAVPENLAQVGLDPEEWEALHEDSRRLIVRGCLDKQARSMDQARREAARKRRSEGTDSISCYRCPYTQGAVPNHYHVGHIASVPGLEAIALVVRDIHGNRPTEVTAS